MLHTDIDVSIFDVNPADLSDVLDAVLDEMDAPADFDSADVTFDPFIG